MAYGSACGWACSLSCNAPCSATGWRAVSGQLSRCAFCPLSCLHHAGGGILSCSPPIQRPGKGMPPTVPCVVPLPMRGGAPPLLRRSSQRPQPALLVLFPPLLPNGFAKTAKYGTKTTKKTCDHPPQDALRSPARKPHISHLSNNQRPESRRLAAQNRPLLCALPPSQYE